MSSTARPLRPIPELAKKIYKQDESMKQMLKIQDEYLVKRPEPRNENTVGSINTIREAILRLSLFPNRANKLGWATDELGTFRSGGNI